jgi:2-polyprenyl-6-methoxyphenol hydroxylase-like FAD-dependent oxidoreductase
MKNLDEIVIVGGGSAAWLAAALLAHNTPELKLTVIDKEVGTPVGVGEGTLLNFEIYLKRCGFSVDEWFTAVDATYKTAILFPNWDREGNDIWHPFLSPEVLPKECLRLTLGRTVNNTTLENTAVNFMTAT